MAISPVDPPINLSTQRLVTTMSTGATGDDWVGGWGYPPNRFGAVNSVGARLKHRTNIYNGCNISPYQDMLATIYIKWLTMSFKFPLASTATHNVAVEMVPNPSFGRIRPDLNSGLKQWVQLNTPNGRVVSGYIATGATIGSPPDGDILRDGRVTKLPNTYILHPWAVVSGTSNIDAPITALVSQNSSDDFADSRLDCIVCDWWVRLVPFNESLPLDSFVTNGSNPVICVASADPYVQRPRFGLTNDDQCTAGIAASCVFRLTTEWQQIGFFTSTDAPDLHTTLPYSGISNTEFLTSPPPGYDQNVVIVPTPDPIVVAPSVGNWFNLLTGGQNTWGTWSSTASAPTSLDNDDQGDEMLIQQSAATAAKRTIIFRAVDETDGFTAETGLSWGAGDIKISKNGAAEANHAGTVTEIAGGMYKYEFALAELDTVGVLSFRTNKSGVRPTAFVHQVVAFDPGNATSLGVTNIDATITSRLAGSVYENVDAFLDKANGIETGVTPRGALRLMLAALAGKLSGAGTTTETFRNAVADTKARITATVDTSGNRTAITTDQT